MGNKKCAVWLLPILLAFMAQAVYIYAFFIEPNWIQVKKITIQDPSLAHALKGIRVMQISDLHITKIGFLETSLIEKVNALSPDIILITGDFVNSKKGILACWDTLSLLEAKIGIYAVPGDIDGYFIASLLDDPRWKKAGVTMLKDRAIKLNPSGKPGNELWLIGGHREADIKRLTEKTLPYEPKILMLPDPDRIKEAAILEINLVLAGDTHGGQVNPPLLRGIIPFAVENRSPYVAGLFKVMNTLLYVNRGIGTHHINVRFFCRPEITVFEFSAEKPSTHLQILPRDKGYTSYN